MQSVTCDRPGEGRLTLLGGGGGTAAVFLALLFLSATAFPNRVMAEGINGSMDLGYSALVSRASETSGPASRTENSGYTQRYNLAFSNMLYPHLRLSGGGLFQKANNTSMSEDTETKSTLTRMQPSMDLTLKTPLYTAGARYIKREETASSSTGPSATKINETSSAVLGWRPDGLPSIEMRADRSNTYDKERVSQDTVRDFVGLTMAYAPLDNLSIGYRPSYTDTTDRLTTLETKQLVHVGRVDYSDRFLQDRISFSTSYNVARSEVKTSSSGTGLVDLATVPFSGLSSIDDTPDDGALAPAAALIDGDLTISAGINIGLPPISGDRKERNIGLDFSFAQQVNMLRVWVDRELPAEITNSFSWNIYTSPDNLVWTLQATVFPASFGTFDKRFELSFAPVTTRYIKVAAQPLASTVTGASGYPDIQVTELQAFQRTAAGQGSSTRSSVSNVYNVDGKVLLLDIPNLYYQVSYFYTKAEHSSQERWNLSNGLSISHRFNKVFSGSAHVGVEDYSEPTGKGVAYVANTSLTAVPLKTLRHSLTYSGRFEQNDDGRSDANSVFLHNYAELYRGINLMLSGGETFQNKNTGEHAIGTTWSALANLLPHPSLNLTWFFSSTRSEQSGGGKPDTTSTTDRTDMSATYTPFRTLYLVATLSTISDPVKVSRTSNYALDWSPFPDGTLLFSFAYNESQASGNNAKSTSLAPGLRWNFSRKAYLTASYQVANEQSDAGQADSTTFSTNLTAFF